MKHERDQEAELSSGKTTSQAGFGEAREVQINGQIDDLYYVAETIYNARVEQLKRDGLLRSISEITDEWELDDHFDDLRRVYRQVCGELGLAWPPSPVDETTDPPRPAESVERESFPDEETLSQDGEEGEQ